MQAITLSRVLTLIAVADVPLLAVACLWTFWFASKYIVWTIVLFGGQFILSCILLNDARAVSPATSKEGPVMVFCFLLLVLSKVQLVVTPIISGGASSGEDWDVYPGWLNVLHRCGSVLSAGAALMALGAVMQVFLSNTHMLYYKVRHPLVQVCSWKRTAVL